VPLPATCPDVLKLWEKQSHLAGRDQGARIHREQLLGFLCCLRGFATLREMRLLVEGLFPNFASGRPQRGSERRAPSQKKSRRRLGQGGRAFLIVQKLAVQCERRGMTVANLERITTDPARMNGEPCIRNLRLTVRRVLEALASYPDRAERKREYPELEDEDIRQALAFAAASLDDKLLPPVAPR
jgi:uncharacterized protein (DUF433 family)